MAEIAADNLIAGVTGQALRAWVNPEVAAKRRTLTDQFFATEAQKREDEKPRMT